MEMNHHYADYEGFVGGDRIAGRARNVQGLKWRWSARLTTDPEKCELGDPIRTISAAHAQARSRRPLI